MSNPRVWAIGTVTVTGGSTAVTGDDTGWVVAGIQYGTLIKDGLSVPIASVEGDEALTLELPWPGATGTGVYAILRENSDAANVVDLFDRLTQALITLSLAGIHPDGLGTLAQRDAYGATLTAEDKKIWLHAELGEDFAYYVWNGPTSTAWLGPYPVAQASAPGTPGAPGSAEVVGTSTTSLLIETGSKAFTVIETDRGWGVGARLRASSDADPTNFMEGLVASYSGTSLTLTVDLVGGSGTFSDWTINLAGERGATGAQGEQGEPGSTGSPGADGGKGWSPVFALATDGARRVLQLADWVGGEGTEPAAGDYVGAAGLTPVIGDAIDIRGPSGTGTGDVTTSGTATAGRLARFADGTGDILEDSGVAIIDEDNMASDSVSHLPTQQSVKAYVDAAIAAIKNGVAAAGDTLAELYSLITSHTSNTANPHSVTKSQVGLGNVDNTSDATKNAAVATLSGKTLVDPAITGCILEDIFTITDAAAFEIDPSNGSIQFVTLGANRTPAATNFQNGESVTLRIADGSAFTVTWTTVGVVWKGGTAPTLATIGYTEVHLEKAGGVIRGVHIGDFAS